MSGQQSVSMIFGTSFDDDLIGSARREKFWGFEGRDRIYARDGNDTLYGGAGDDLLDGGSGRDEMYGGSGDDSYRVDDPGDLVSEETTPGQDDGGTDTVISTISYKLGNYVEVLTLSGSASIDAIGNDLDNRLKGNDANNVLFGGLGSDILYGYGGDDILHGGLGRDYYTGGAGADTFVFHNEKGEWDRVYDFTAEDRFGLIADEFGLSEGAGLSGGVLMNSYFVSGTAATAQGHSQFIFNTAKNELLWDADGVGGVKPYRIALITTSTPITADKFFAFGETASVSVSAFDPAGRAENDGPIYFSIRLSQPVIDDVILTYSTADGTAQGGQDFAAISSGQVLLKAGETTAYVAVDLFDDNIKEGLESFSLTVDSAHFAGSGHSLSIGTGSAQAFIADEGACVVAEYATASYGMTDPSAIAYDPFTKTLFMADSEVDEGPFYQSENLFALGLGGNLKYTVSLPFTDEPTGLAFDGSTGILYITDDDEYRVYAVDASNPTAVLWSFDTQAIGGNDPEDIAINSVTGNLYIVNGTGGTIIETDRFGLTQIRSIQLPSEIYDPEALAYDASENVFYVGGGFSPNIWKVDLNGEILDVITLLEGHRSADLNRRVHVKDIELAPASDGSGEMHLYVADYGWSHEADGRLFEIDLGDNWSYGF